MAAGPAVRTHDGRLVPGAVGGWLATYGGLAWPAGWCLLLGGVGLVAGGLALLGRWRWSGVLALALGCAGAALVGTGLRVVARDGSPLAGLASQRAAGVLWVTVRDDPRLLAVRGTGGGMGGGPEVAVPARVDQASVGGRSWRLSGRVVVLAPAEGWRSLLPSQRVRLHAQLGPPLGRDLTVAMLSTRAPPDEVGPPSWTQRLAGRLRAGLRDAAAGLPPGARGLLPGLVVGDTSGMDPVLAADFRTTGLSHLTAVSGMNVTLVVGAVLLLLRALSAGPMLSALAGGVALVGFVLLARPSPSVLRAAVMGGVTLLALAVGRSRSVLPALAASVLGLLWWQPELARSAGFALSVVATAGLVLLAPGWTAALRAHRVPAGVAEGLAVAAAAFVVTAPLLAGLGGAVSLVTVPANLLAAPAVAPATVLGLLAAVVSPASAGVAHALATVAGVPAGWIAVVAEHGAAVPAAALPWPAGWRGGAVLAVALAVLWAAARSAAARRVGLAVLVGAVLVGLPVRALTPAWPPSGWLLAACDVGQGDALAVHAGGDSAVVVDAGPDPVAVDACLHRLGVRRVSLLVLTHLHADHVGGLSGVLHGRQVGAVATGPLHEPGWAWRAVTAEASGARVPLLALQAGEVREVAGVRIEVLGPERAFHGTRSDPNNSSVVLRVAAHGHTMLLSGDAEIDAQRALLRDRPGELPAEVLKVPHHGSAYSDPAFLGAVHAQVGIVSVGEGNDYGHPSPLLLAELDRLGVRILRTDTSGDIVVCEQDGRLVVYPRARGSPAG